MEEIKDEDAKLFVDQNKNLDSEKKINVKLPKKSFKDNKPEQDLEENLNNETSDITKVADAEKFINENKPKRLRFAEEKTTSNNTKINNETNKEKEKNLAIDEEIDKELNSIESEEKAEFKTDKNGVVYEYRENK